MKLLCTVVSRACLACLSKQARERRHFADADAPSAAFGLLFQNYI